jgi:tail tape-measure protein
MLDPGEGIGDVRQQVLAPAEVPVLVAECDAHLRERILRFAGPLSGLGGTTDERCSAMSSVCCPIPDALAAKRSSCSASTPTPILSAVLPIASAAEIDLFTSAARPPTVVTPASAPPSVRMPARSSSAWRPMSLSPPEALPPAVSMRFRLCSPLPPTETSSAFTWPPPSTASRIAYVCVRRAIRASRAVEGLSAERAALGSTEREQYVAQATSRLSAEATALQRREVEGLAGALYDERQALQARQRLMDEGSSVTDRTRIATEQYAAEVENLDELLAAGAIDQQAYARAVEEANDRALRSGQAWTDGATRFLKDYVAESEDAATATERAFASAFIGAEDALVGFVGTGKLEFQGLADSILADLARTTVRQTITAPLAGLCRARSPVAAASGTISARHMASPSPR